MRSVLARRVTCCCPRYSAVRPMKIGKCFEGWPSNSDVRLRPGPECHQAARYSAWASRLEHRFSLSFWCTLQEARRTTKRRQLFACAYASLTCSDAHVLNKMLTCSRLRAKSGCACAGTTFLPTTAAMD
eukprot:6182073-Pleurochrysis_carterae.AAC.1